MKSYKKRKPEYRALQWTGDNISKFEKEFSHVDKNSYDESVLTVSLWRQKKRGWVDYNLAVGQYIVTNNKNDKARVLDADKFCGRYQEV